MVLCFFTPLGPFIFYWRNFSRVLRFRETQDVKQQLRLHKQYMDTCMFLSSLRNFEAFFEAIPQLMVQTFLQDQVDYCSRKVGKSFNI